MFLPFIKPDCTCVLKRIIKNLRTYENVEKITFDNVIGLH